MRRCVRWWLVLVVAASAQAATVTGQVFLDRDGNGRQDAGEPGVAGAVVADDRGLTRTDAAGQFRLETPDADDVVFVVNPRGTWPGGRWWAWLPGGQATGELSFALRPDEQTGPLVFAQGTDIHLQASAAALYQRYVEAVSATPARFVVHTGDLIRDGNPLTVDQARTEFGLYRQLTAAVRQPVREVPGNHEVIGLANPQVAPTPSRSAARCASAGSPGAG